MDGWKGQPPPDRLRIFITLVVWCCFVLCVYQCPLFLLLCVLWEHIGLDWCLLFLVEGGGLLLCMSIIFWCHFVTILCMSLCFWRGVTWKHINQILQNPRGLPVGYDQDTFLYLTQVCCQGSSGRGHEGMEWYSCAFIHLHKCMPSSYIYIYTHILVLNFAFPTLWHISFK
jgi:hypothetical protein